MKKEEIGDLLDHLVGLKARNVKLGIGSFIFIEFGRDMERKIKTKKGMITQVRGEWSLWIYMCAWRLDQDGTPLAGCEDKRKKIEGNISILENKKLKKITLLSDAFDLKMEFEKKIVLYLFAINTEDEEQWKMFTPDKKVFIAGPSTSWSLRKSGE